MESTVTLTPVDPPGAGIRFGLDGVATPAGGVGGWEVIARPKRRGITHWAGVAPAQLTLPLITSMFDVAPGVNLSVEPKLAELKRLALKVPNGSRPPVLTVAGPVDGTALRWVIETIEWGDHIRRSDGQRIQQELVVTLLEYVQGDVVITAPADQARGRLEAAGAAVGGVYTVRAGDTLSAIAARELGDFRRWRELLDADTGQPIRDPLALQVGQRLRLP